MKTTPTVHYLKCWPEFFEPVKKGPKPFELRKNDRDSKDGDILVLQEWNQGGSGYTGRECVRIVSYIINSEMGVKDGYCAMGIKKSFLLSMKYKWHKMRNDDTVLWRG